MQELVRASLADLKAFKFGNAENAEAGTGCTVILCPDGAVSSVDVRGAAPATSETDLLDPQNTVQCIHGVVLTGGSAFGLASSQGVVEGLSGLGVGFFLRGFYVPVVSTACLFDLLVGDGSVRPDAEMGSRAFDNAMAGEPFLSGNHGAGTGCSSNKWIVGDPLVKTGLGKSAVRIGDLIVGAVVAVNACGRVNDLNGAVLTKNPDDDSEFNSFENLKRTAEASYEADNAQVPLSNTTIGCIVTNAAISKVEAKRVAAMGHDAYARMISPVHGSQDGDLLYCMASGEVEASQDLVSIMANYAIQEAILDSVQSAESAYGIPCACKS